MAAEPAAYVLDSFALLAYLEGEAGMPRVKVLLEEADSKKHNLFVSLISVGEVLYITERERGLIQAQQALAAIDQLPFQIVPITRTTVLAAAHIKAHYPISYADAFAVAAAQEYDGILVTGDPEFKAIEREKLIHLEWLPRR